MKTPFKSSAIALGLILAVPVLALAWTSAPANPPNSNVDAPVNQGLNYQHKTGPLQIGVLGVDGGGIIAGHLNVGRATDGSYSINVGMPEDGLAVGASAFYYMSDASLKDNIATLSDSLSKVLQLRGVSFNWKKSGKPDVGVVAQEVEKVFPEVVNTGTDGIKAVEYGHLVGPLIEAIKAQQQEIDALKAEVAALKAAK